MRWLPGVGLALACLSWTASSYDVLELPAEPSALASRAVVYSVREYYGTVYATGQRGHILFSEDAGETWQQAAVPVRSDLLDTHFPTRELGWAIGHDGVILHSVDAGRTWELQFDGFRLSEQGLAWYQRKARENPDEPFYEVLVGEMEFGKEQGADKPFFVVRFSDEQQGRVLGAYGLMLETRDGGVNWYPVMEQLMYDQFVHLYDVAVQNAGLVIVGEMGQILAWDKSTGRYEVEESPYNGSLFTVLAPGPDQLLVAGLRGKAFYRPGETLPWQAVEKPQSGSIVEAILLADGRILLASSDGTLMVSDDPQTAFQALDYEYPGVLSSVAEVAPGRLVLAGAAGLQRTDLATLSLRAVEN